jgi:two-component system alkaline phosphatase synthesis response regulator PhoP
MTSRILLVEDEENLREAIKMNLELDGYEVEVADTGTQALKKTAGQRFNLIILDVMLPEMDGFDVCQKIRITDTDTPVLFLTAKDTSQDKVNGFKHGADDYLTKPFNLEELLLRVRVLIRHSVRGKREVEEIKSFRFGNNEVNFITFKAKGVGGTEIALTKKEISLLKLLVDRKGEVVSRTQILQFVWGYDIFPSTRTIDNFILTFRKYFETDPGEPKYFHSIRGVGYKFTE